MLLLFALLSLAAIFAFSLYRLLSMAFNRSKVIGRLFADRPVKNAEEQEARVVTRKPQVNAGGIMYWLERRLLDASISTGPVEFLRNYLLVCLTAAIILLVTVHSLGMATAVVLTITAALWLFLGYAKRKRIKLIEQQLPDIVDFLSGCLKTGYSLMQSLNTIVEESPPPISIEFSRVLQDIKLGKTYDEAFAELVSRTPLEDMEILVNGILLSKETGGNLSHILETIGNTIREKESIKRELKSLTAQGRLSGIILVLLPIAVFALLTIINPTYCKPLFTHPAGKLMLGGGIFSQVIGGLIIKKIVKIEW